MRRPPGKSLVCMASTTPQPPQRLQASALLRALFHHEQCATAHAELAENVMEVLLDRPFRDAESMRNLAVGHPLHQQIDDLPLTARERGGQLARGRLGCLAPVALPSLALAAVAHTPVRAFAALGERPLQLGRRIPVPGRLVVIAQVPRSCGYPSKRDTNEFCEGFPPQGTNRVVVN